MVTSNSISFVRACAWALILTAAACEPKKPAAMSVADLMEDRVALDGILLKCNQEPGSASTEAACVNARIASERLASRNDSAQEAKRAEEFERHRERLRVAEEQRRQEEAAKKVDAYHLPVVPLDSSPPSAMADAAERR